MDLKKDFQSAKRIEKLKKSADFTIYTPGSNMVFKSLFYHLLKLHSKEVLEEDNDLLVSLDKLYSFIYFIFD